MQEYICNAVIIVSGIFILGNWSGLVGSYYSKKNYSFAPPFLAGLAAMVAILVHPTSELHRFAWIPLLLDPSIGLALSFLAFKYLKRNRNDV